MLIGFDCDRMCMRAYHPKSAWERWRLRQRKTCWGPTFCLEAVSTCTGWGLMEEIEVEGGLDAARKKVDWLEVGLACDALKLLEGRRTRQDLLRMLTFYIGHNAGGCGSTHDSFKANDGEKEMRYAKEDETLCKLIRQNRGGHDISTGGGTYKVMMMSDNFERASDCK